VIWLLVLLVLVLLLLLLLLLQAARFHLRLILYRMV